MNRHYFTLCMLAIAFILIPFTSKASAYTSAVYKVKPHHTTAVYETNDTTSLKLFHTKANRHVIVHNQTKNGSIILMHDSNVATQNGLANVIDYLQQNGYIIVTVSELLQQ